MKVALFSSGVSSFCALLLAQDVDRILYTHIDDQHEDTLRYLADCEAYLGHKIEILQSPYKTVDAVVRAHGYVNGPAGAKCTEILKRRVRKKWEAQQSEPITYIWGYDVGERHRAERGVDAMPEYRHEFPLIDASLTKADAHGMLYKTGIKRPYMYDMGYPNNNCIGCVKGGMGYWNRIRRDFPDVFRARAEMERAIGHSCINGVFLDELEPDRGAKNIEIMPECSIMCEIASDRLWAGKEREDEQSNGAAQQPLPWANGRQPPTC